MLECNSVFEYLLEEKEKEKDHLKLGRNFPHRVQESEVFLSCATKKLKGPMENLSN